MSPIPPFSLHHLLIDLDAEMSLLVKAGGMGAVAFDTHEVVEDLKRAEFNDEQAEAVVSAVGEAVGENVATKADPESMETRAGPNLTKTDLYRAFWIQTWVVFAWTITVLWLLH